MKYLADQNKIITEFTKYLLTTSDNEYQAAAYMIRDLMHQMDLTGQVIDRRNRLHLIGCIQDMFDIINNTSNCSLSGFDIEFDEDSFSINYMYDYEDMEDELYHDLTTIAYLK